MRNKIIFGALLTAVLLSPSCKDTLDTHPTKVFTDEMVWGSKASADGFVNATYNYIPSLLDTQGNIHWCAAAWEARTPNSIKASQVGGDGWEAMASETSISNAWDFGVGQFGLLRRCNLIIEKAQASNAYTDIEKANLVAQGRFLRGMTFFAQTRKMGRYVPIKEVLAPADTLKCRVPMTKDVAESYKILMEDLIFAADHLAEKTPRGIANKWAAKVILSRAALQAYAYTMDKSYLDIAERAANDVIQKSGIPLTDNYGGMFNETDRNNPEILWAYYRLAKNTTFSNSTGLMRIFPNCSLDDQKKSKSANLYPTGLSKFECWAVFFPTQDMVDQYLVIDAKTKKAMPWWETSQYKESVEAKDFASLTDAGVVDAYERTNGEKRRIPTPQDLKDYKEGYDKFKHYAELKADAKKNISELMYEGRDARFYSSIVYDGTTWLDFPIGLNLSGNLSQGVRDKEDGGWYNTTTGYYWRKNTIEKPDPRAFHSAKTDFHYCLARVGEAYMNLAEVKLLKNDVAGAVEALNGTRVKHGKLPASEASTLEEAWADYIRERRVEMTGEGADIYFSYLRWGKYGGFANGGQAAGGIVKDLDRPVYKIEISRDRKKMIVVQHTLNGTSNRNFTPKRYLFPIQKGFLDKREAYGLDHEQNPGW